MITSSKAHLALESRLGKIMELVRSDSSEVINNVSTGARVTWGSYLLAACITDAFFLVIAFPVAMIVSVRVAVWFVVLTILASDAVLLWRARSPRVNWVVAAYADRLYVRLFQSRVRGWPVIREPDLLILEASDIASMSAQTIELFLYGPKPKVIEWLMIEPAGAVAEAVSDHIRPLQCGMSPNVCGIRQTDPDKQVFVGNGEGPLTIEWKWCRPALRTFLQQVAQQCPSIGIGPENRSELDLNGIWHGLREEPNAQQRRLLVHAARLGFGHKLVELLSLYRFCTFPSYHKALAYLAEIEREEAETEHSAVSG